MAYNLSFNSLQCLADQVTQSAATNRTVWNIIWSSLTTIFACTWVSCHPNVFLDKNTLVNIRKKHEGKWKDEDEDEDEKERSIVEHETISQMRSKGWWPCLQKLASEFQSILVALVTPEWWRWCWPSDQMIIRVKIILVALIAPEFIVMWALRQYSAARDIVKRSKGLTMTHAFFSLMGGFVITDKDQHSICPLVLRPTLIPGLHSVMLFAVSTDEAKACFKTCVRASNMAPTITGVDEAAETLADMLVTAILSVVVGFGSLSIVFKYKAVLKQLQHEALDVIGEAVDKIEREIQADELDDDWTAGRLNQLHRGQLWDSRKDEIRDKIEAILQDKLQNSLRDWSRNIRSSLVSCPEEDIKDRSKRDWLAKTFALAQTAWFAAQCIARRAQKLPLTEIELVTCAYAALSIAIYSFWWYKPFGVQFPIIVRTEIPLKEERCSTFKMNLWDVSTFARFLVGSVYDDISFRQQLRVPTFYSGHCQAKAGNFWNFVAEIATAAVFGGIHLFAWNYEFPTQIELWYWRVSALVVVGVLPVALMPMVILTRPDPLNTPVPCGCHRVSKYLLFILVLLYIIARISLLVLSLVSLRRLPVGTLTDVDWLTFIPHID